MSGTNSDPETNVVEANLTTALALENLLRAATCFAAILKQYPSRILPSIARKRNLGSGRHCQARLYDCECKGWHFGRSLCGKWESTTTFSIDNQTFPAAC
jgi:hypothetical protein